MVQKPWSGWWWPTGNCSNLPMAAMDGPLDTFDKYIQKKTNINPESVKWEKTKHCDSCCGWCGHCHGWSAASILEPEPTTSVTADGITFNVAALKGLLTELHCTDSVDLWKGVRGKPGTGENDKLLANEFHQVLIDWVANGVPVVMDLTDSPSVWNYPVYDCQMTQSAPGADGKIHITCTIWYASDAVGADFVGSQDFSETHSYWIMENFNNPVAGDWEGSSINKHPGFIWHPDFVNTTEPGANPIVKYYNPYILDLIQKIKDAAQAGPGMVIPGYYKAIIMALSANVMPMVEAHVTEPHPATASGALRRALINTMVYRPETMAVRVESLPEAVSLRREEIAPVRIIDPLEHRLVFPEWKTGTWWELQVQQRLKVAVQPSPGLTLPTRMHFEVINETEYEGNPCHHVTVSYPDRPPQADFKYAEIWFSKDDRKPLAGILHFGDKNIPMHYDFLMEMLKETPLGVFEDGTPRIISDRRRGRLERLRAFEVSMPDSGIHLSSIHAPFPIRLDNPDYTVQLMNWGG